MVPESQPKKEPAKPAFKKPEGAGPSKPHAEAPKPTGKPEKETKLTEAKARAAEAEKRGKAPAKTAEKVEIVEKPTERKHQPKAKPQLTAQQRSSLALRDVIDRRRPAFRHQQWYEYKRLENLGWRRPNGVDSAMRRHFGYEQSVVRVGFRGPSDVRGLHSSGFKEVRVETLGDLAGIDPKTQAARISRTLGTRKLKLIYVEADKRGIRVLNRRKLE